MNTNEPNMAAFRGALFLAALVSFTVMLIVGGLFKVGLAVGLGLSVLTFVIALVYLFGVAIGEW